MNTGKAIRKLIGAVMPHEPKSLREQRLLELAEQALEELESLESQVRCETYTSSEVP